MPFVELTRPCLGLSLLKSLLAREGLEARVEYATFSLVEAIGINEYQAVTGSNRLWSHAMLGEYLYSRSAFSDQQPDEQAMLDVLFAYSPLAGEQLRQAREASLKWVRRMSEKVQLHIEEVARKVLAQQPRLVGCTSTFQQHLASLALLRRIRELAPEVATVMGGANCETQMGAATHRNFPWVDYVLSGDGDGVVGELFRAILEGGPLPRGALGPQHREDGYPKPLPRAVYRALDSLPLPDFSDYFQQLEASSLRNLKVGLPVETSRGCWWGAVSHCTFCGLNGGSMGYSSKSPDLVLREFDELSSRWEVRNFEVVDNILDMAYFKSLVPALAKRDFNLFYETKSNLKRSQIEALAQAGIRWIQPGIESLDTRVLDLMKKGAKGITQVNLLKWARVYGIQLSYNLLWDFPGEEDAWYARAAELIPLIHHLQPPAGITNIRFDRYSPYFRRRAELGFELRPHPMMEHAYCLPAEELDQLAYHFYRTPKAEAGPGVRALYRAVEEWQRSFSNVRLELDGGVLRDDRGCTPQADRRLSQAEVDLLELCAEGATARSLVGQEELVADLVEQKLLLQMDGRTLSLPLPPTAPAYPYSPPFPGGEVMPDLFKSLYRPYARA